MNNQKMFYLNNMIVASILLFVGLIFVNSTNVLSKTTSLPQANQSEAIIEVDKDVEEVLSNAEGISVTEAQKHLEENGVKLLVTDKEIIAEHINSYDDLFFPW